LSIEILQAITQTEKEAEEIRKKAAADARQTVADAREEARKLLEEALKQAEITARNMLNQAEDSVRMDLQQLQKQAEEECAGIRQKAAANMETAVAIIIGRIVKPDGNR
jgi:V/A-type H+/Na+-transporting ATPase subunit G/H